MVKKKKDFGEHDKKTTARERKAATQKEEKERSAKEVEDRYWTEAGEGSLTKAQAKRREQEKQRQETLARKQEIKELAKTEEESLGKPKPKERRAPPKVTHHVLLQEREKAAAELETELHERQKAERKEVDEETYARLVEVENANRADTIVEARNVDDAIVALRKLKPDDETEIPEDMHPEKRRKAAFKKFYEAQLVDLKEEKPGLKLSQYKDMIFKRWLKSPDNPMNQSADG